MEVFVSSKDKLVIKKAAWFTLEDMLQYLNTRNKEISHTQIISVEAFTMQGGRQISGDSIKAIRVVGMLEHFALINSLRCILIPYSVVCMLCGIKQRGDKNVRAVLKKKYGEQTKVLKQEDHTWSAFAVAVAAIAKLEKTPVLPAIVTKKLSFKLIV